jgi:probable HAF family extracellular repeat protein
MPHRIHTACLALVVGCLTYAAAQAAPPERDRVPHFAVEPLSSLNFGDRMISAVNDKGSAVGAQTTRAGSDIQTTAFFRDKQGNVTTIGDLPGGRTYVGLYKLNEHDWAVGMSDGGVGRQSSFHAVVWNPRDGLIDLGPSSSADGINDHNQVVGYVDSGGPRRAFVWEPGQGMRTLPVPAGSGTSQASGINNKGTIVGHTYTAGESMQHATLWTKDGRYVDLGELPGGYEEAAAFAVNEKDHVVGYTITEQDHRAFFWSRETGMINLGALPGTTEGSVAHDINDDDWVVGTSRSPGTTAAGKPFLWTPEWGLIDLNDRLDAASKDWKLYEAKWVNDKGDILGIGQLGATYHVVLLHAHMPEPGAVALLAGGAASLVLRRRRPVTP